MTFVHDDALDRSVRWLGCGASLVVDGDAGSGRTTLLEAITQHHLSRGVPAMLLRASVATATLPLGVFLVHPTFAAAAATSVESVARVSQALQAELAGPRALVLVDDAEHLDPTSLAVLDAAVAQGGVLTVLALPLGQRPGPAHARLLRDASVLTVPPLDLTSLTAVLSDELGAPVAAPLVTSLAARSAGNPRVAVALARAGVWSGSIVSVHDVWTETGSLESSPTGAVAQAMLGPLTEPERAALETLAWFGVTDLERADRLVGRPLLERLSRLGRVALQPQSPSPLVTVSPRALARALRFGVGPLRHERLVEQARELEDEPGGPGVIGAVAPSSEAWWQTLGERGDFAQRSLVDAVTVIFESLHAQTGLRARRWRATPSVQNALPLLRRALLDGAGDVDVDDVLARTEAGLARADPGEQDESADVAELVLLRAQWSAARGQGFAHGLAADPTGRLVLPAPGPELVAAMDLVADGAPPVVVDRALDGTGDLHPMLRQLADLQHVHALFDLGRPADAFDVLDSWPEGRFRDSFSEHLAALRGDALMLQGRIADAERWARTCLRSAAEQLDAFGIRLACRGLATALLVAGDVEGAGDAITAAMSLGAPGPLVSSFDDRVVGLGAIVHARLGRLEVARALADELACAQHAYRPTLDIGLPWVRAELAVAAGEGVQEAADALWAHGERQLADGAALPAVLAWAMTPVPLPAERARALAAAWAQVDAEMLRPLIELHLVLPKGSHEQILRRIRPLRTDHPLVAAALAVARERALAAGVQLDAELVTELGGSVAGTHWQGATRAPRQEPLSDREREIVLLARSGLSNREIAGQLYVSVRTVESHLYRAMRKLEIANRAELSSWSPAVSRGLAL
ncbi:MAG TPA: LuxR C-terminal-related transcriptional regulator [Cellulomonas sp.]